MRLVPVILLSISNLPFTSCRLSSCQYMNLSLVSLMQTSHCSLKVLNIKWGIFTAEEYIRLLEMIPTLLKLSIPSPSPSQAIMMGVPKFLRLLHEKPSVVPSLRTLEIGNHEKGIPVREQLATCRALQELLPQRRGLRIRLWDAVEDGESARREYTYTAPATALAASVEALDLRNRSNVRMPTRRPVHYRREAN